MSDQVSLAFLGGSPGPGELVLLFLVVLVLFGPRRLPEMARKAGKMFEELRRASQDFRDQVMQIEKDPPKTLPQNTQPEPPPVAEVDPGVQNDSKADPSETDVTADQVSEKKDKKEDDPYDEHAG